MNFLAHIYLSGNDPDVLLGNFMADNIKGRDLSRFSDGVRRGIQLHRNIDHFTDTHAISGEGRKILRGSMGKYSGVVLDVFYDHFLAVSWNTHHKVPLELFIQNSYAFIEGRKDEMPEKTIYLFQHMKQHDWLGSYAAIDGIARALTGLSRRVSHGEQMAYSRDVLIDNYDELSNNFDMFFPHLVENCHSFLNHTFS